MIYMEVIMNQRLCQCLRLFFDCELNSGLDLIHDFTMYIS